MNSSNEKNTTICFIALIVYIITLFYLAVLNRVPVATNSIKLDLFWGYKNPSEYIYRDNIINVASFIPIGFLAGMIIKMYRVLKAMLVGLFVSLVIESSQLIWNRGTFDVDDLFNNTVGACIGSAIVTLFVVVRKKKQVE